MPPKRKSSSPLADQPKAKKRSKASSFHLKSLLKERSWRRALQEVFREKYVEDLQKKLEQDYSGAKQIFPRKEKIFNAFNLTPIDKVKVVILGEKPYCNKWEADGLAFSTPKGDPFPPSLDNIFKELEKDIQGFKRPNVGSLEKWAAEGVFLLNAKLTVGDSHKDYGWQKLTDQVIKIISDQCPFVVFILWRSFAQTKRTLIDDKKHTIIGNEHPTLVSIETAYCKCFSETNAALEKNSQSPVNWSLA